VSWTPHDTYNQTTGVGSVLEQAVEHTNLGERINSPGFIGRDRRVPVIVIDDGKPLRRLICMLKKSQDLEHDIHHAHQGEGKRRVSRHIEKICRQDLVKSIDGREEMMRLEFDIRI
jgi:hypothetical protein